MAPATVCAGKHAVPETAGQPILCDRQPVPSCKSPMYGMRDITAAALPQHSHHDPQPLCQ